MSARESIAEYLAGLCNTRSFTNNFFVLPGFRGFRGTLLTLQLELGLGHHLCSLLPPPHSGDELRQDSVCCADGNAVGVNNLLYELKISRNLVASEPCFIP